MIKKLCVFPPLLLLLSLSLFATKTVVADPTLQDHATSQICKVKGIAPPDRVIVKGIEEFLYELEGYFADSGKEDERKLAHEYILRTRLGLIEPVDHLHGRCWNQDQLSCTMLLSSIHEISSFLSSLHRSNPLAALPRLVTKVEGQALTLSHFCKTQPWKLS